MLVGLLLIVQIIVAIALTGVILLQRSEGGALGMGGSSGFMTARGAGDLLTRTTGILATIFFILSIALTVVVGKDRGASSVVDRLKVDALNPDALNRSVQPQPTTPTTPATPPPSGGLFQAPTPQVNGAPAVNPTVPPPGATQDSGANAPASQVFGVQTAPQAPQPQAPAK